MDKNKLILGIVIIVMSILFSTFVSAATLTRTASATTVNPGATFTVTYSTSQAIEGKWFVGWSDVVTGGCTPAAVNFFLSSGDPPVLISDSKSFTFTAPSSGSCTFTGYYQFTDGSQTNFPTLTVDTGTPPESNKTLIYVLVGVVVFLVLFFLLKKK